MITGTPIIIRIPREKYIKYGISPPSNYDYLYWKADHPLELFLSQLWVNLQKKYNEYTKTNIADRSLYHSNKPLSFFGELIFKKQISTKLFVKNTEQTVIGTTWEFLFEGHKYREMIQFALDVGLGERNSMGFGFMNLKK
jgi:CRISPR-associated endoribonuclease Cas6